MHVEAQAHPAPVHRAAVEPEGRLKTEPLQVLAEGEHRRRIGKIGRKGLVQHPFRDAPRAALCGPALGKLRHSIEILFEDNGLLRNGISMDCRGRGHGGITGGFGHRHIRRHASEDDHPCQKPLGLSLLYKAHFKRSFP